MLKKILSSVFIVIALTANAQGILDRKLDGTEKGKPLATFLLETEKQSGAHFYFRPEWLASATFQQSYQGRTLGDALEDLFRGTDLSYFAMYDNAVVIVKDPAQAMLRKNALEAAIHEHRKIDQRLFGDPAKPKKRDVIIRGRITDAKTKEPLARATIQVSDSPEPTITDEQGNYTLSLHPGVHAINISFVDHESSVIDLAAYDDGTMDLALEEMAVLLQEVVIQDQAPQEIATSRIGTIHFAMSELKHAPPFLGEVDLVKQVQMLPGVTTVGEAALGFNVRGGSVDQNLILYDGIPVYNSSHVFGFLSSFNPEAVRDVSFYRGGIPAEYGGRISSVLDIRSKDGDYQKWHGSGGIGILTSNVMVNGPLNKDKTSLAASFRSTYSDWLVHAVRTDYADLSNSKVSFYDGTLKLTHLYSRETKLSVTAYSSHDAFRLTGDSTYRWSNFALSARLDHQLSEKLGAEFIAGVSSYGYSVTNDDYETASKLAYRLTSTTLKAGFHYQQGLHRVNFGWQLTHYAFNPGTLKPESPVSNASHVSMDRQYSLENAFYVADEWSVTERFSVEAGLRIPTFISFGPANLNAYQPGVPRDVSTVTDTLHFRGAQPIKAYFGLEPRLSLRWMTSPNASVKFGYNHTYQFLHLVSNTTAVTPVDIWQPSGYYFKPQQADQVSLGYFLEMGDRRFGFSVEGFYKKVMNILDFKDGAQLIMNRHLETDLLQGKGKSYGVETSLSKNTGRLTATLNYTYARSFRLIAGPTSAESVNDGKQYPASFDQPHVMNFSWRYNLSRRISFTGNFTYHTGRPVTVPLSAFAVENTAVAYFSGRNQYRIPEYHRLDLALVVEGGHKRSKKWHGTWVVSVYNVYARKNPYTVFFKSTGNGVPLPYQLSIIGTFLPSVSYNFKF